MHPRLTAAVLCALAMGASIASADEPAPSLDAVLALVDDPAPYAGQVVYVDFWASWCVPCRSSFPWMQTLAAERADDGLRVVTVNLDRRAEAADRFIEALEVTLPVLRDPRGDLAKAFGLEVVPTAFVFDRTGAFRIRHEGFRPQDVEAFEARLAALLAEPGPDPEMPAPASSPDDPEATRNTDHAPSGSSAR